MNEAELRGWIESQRHPLAAVIRTRSEVSWYPARPLPPRYFGVPALPGNCLGTAVRLAQQFAVPILTGYAVPAADANPRFHFWNRDEGGVVDATWDSLGGATGYLGFELTRSELAMISTLNLDRVAAARP